MLQKIVSDQRKMIAEHMNEDVTKVPQLWALYKEVQEYYESGMRVPDDITLLWADDNFGNLRRVPTKDERHRKGGAGIYYHLDYVGGPRSYKWVNSVPLQKIWEQMHKAYHYGANQIWILNVGDLKPMEFQLEYFLRMAWNMSDFNRDYSWEYSVEWVKRHFGEEYAEDIAYIINRYSKFNGRLKPEQLNNVDLYSLLNYDEAERVLEDFQEITDLAEQIYQKLPEPLKDPFFQIVLYPTKASKQVLELHIKAEMSKLYAKQDRIATNIAAREAELLFEQDHLLSFDYNKRTSLGKWNHMMDQTHIGYTYWQQPEQNTIPTVKRMKPKIEGKMGIADYDALHFNSFTRQSRVIDIYNKGITPFLYNVKANVNWLIIDTDEGVIIQEKKIVVDIDWDNAPKGHDVESFITVTGSEGSAVQLRVTLFNPIEPNRESLVGFMETDGYISIEAEHYTNKIDSQEASWDVIPDYGRTLSSMTVFPVSTPSVHPPHHSPCLEYQVYITNPGKLDVHTFIAPTLNFIPDQGLRFGISFDDQPIQIVDAIQYKDTGFDEGDWAQSVILNVRNSTTTHCLEKKGYHTLKIWMVDPIVVLQKLVIDTGGLKKSYLGPPESYYGGKKDIIRAKRHSIDSYIIPGRLEKVDKVFQYYKSVDLFVEKDGMYEIELETVGIGSIKLNISDKEYEIVSTENDEQKKVKMYLKAGYCQMNELEVKGDISVQNIKATLEDEDVIKIKPTIRMTRNRRIN
ncbi:glycosyl hydrolase 115 family protein [Alkalihalobacillus hemicellulosilyticus]